MRVAKRGSFVDLSGYLQPVEGDGFAVCRKDYVREGRYDQRYGVWRR